jgi:hypothetical protein
MQQNVDAARCWMHVYNVYIFNSKKLPRKKFKADLGPSNTSEILKWFIRALQLRSECVILILFLLVRILWQAQSKESK